MNYIKVFSTEVAEKYGYHKFDIYTNKKFTYIKWNEFKIYIIETID